MSKFLQKLGNPNGEQTIYLLHVPCGHLLFLIQQQRGKTQLKERDVAVYRETAIMHLKQVKVGLSLVAGEHHVWQRSASHSE